MTLTPKQQRFVDEYLVDLNGTQAAIRAGYSAKTANEQAARLLAKASVKAAIDGAKAMRSERTRIDADHVLARLVEIDQLDVIDILDNAGNLLPIREWPKAWRQTISGVDIQEIMSGDTETVIRKIKWPDKLRNLELIGKHVGVNAFREVVDVTVNVSLADRIARARERVAQSGS